MSITHSKLNRLRKFVGVMLTCLLLVASLAGCASDNSTTGTGTGTTATGTSNSMLSDSYDTNRGLGNNTGTGATGYGAGYSIGSGVKNSDYQNSSVIGSGNTNNLSADM